MQWIITENIVSAVDAQSVLKSSQDAPTVEETRRKCCGVWKQDLDCSEGKQQHSGDDKQYYDVAIIPLVGCQ